MTSFPAWSKAERIQGWFSKAEARLLYDLCDGLWVEIGCHRGRSTTILAETGYDGYAIDNWVGSPDPKDPTFGQRAMKEFLARTGHYENVTVIRADFEKVPSWTIPDEVNLLHLDADHSYEKTKLAWDMYSPKVERFGHVALHDARGGYWPGVEKAIEEIDRGEWLEGPTADLLVTFQRK